MFGVVLNSLAPVFLTMAVGVLLRRLRFLPDGFFGGLNQLAFWVCLPCMLFTEIARCRIAGGTVLTATCLIALALPPTLLAAWVLARLLKTAPASRSVFLQGAFRGNLAYVGIPVITYALARNTDAAGLAALIMAPLTPLYNVVGVLLLVPRGVRGSTWQRWRPTLAAIAMNPLIISCLLGLAAFTWQVTLPQAIGKTLEMLGKAGLTTALLALGASLTFERVRGHFLHATASALTRVVVGPLIGLGLTAWIGLTGDFRTIVLLYLACPTAVASYVMADQMGADKDLAGAIVVLSTLYAFPAMAVVLLLTK
ncbi:MAG: AEC family transporter [bacterium]